MQNTQWGHLREKNGGGGGGRHLRGESSNPRPKPITDSMKQVVQRDGLKTWKYVISFDTY